MAPPMKDLPRWLMDNPEFAVAPDWTEIVKQSVSNHSIFRSELSFDRSVLSLSVHGKVLIFLRSPSRVSSQSPCSTAS